MRDRHKNILSLIVLLSVLSIMLFIGEVEAPLLSDIPFETPECYPTYKDLGYTTCDYPEIKTPNK